MHSELQRLYADFNKNLSEEDKERLENGMYRELRASDGVPDKPRPAADAEERASFWASKAIIDEKTRLGAGPREQEAVSGFREFLRSKNKEHLLDYTIFDQADDFASRNGLAVDRAVGAAEIGAGFMGGASVAGIVTGGLLIHSGYSRLGGVDKSDAPLRVIRSFEAPVGESYIHRKAEALARDTALALGAGKLIGEGAKLAMPALSKTAAKFSVTKAGAGAPATTATTATTAEVKPAGGAGVETRGSAANHSAELKTSITPHPSYIDKQRKGARAEAAAHKTLESAGYEILDSKLPGNRGFDKVAIKRNDKGEIADIMIIESKFRTTGKPSLNKQMSDDWIRGNIEKMIDSTDPKLQEAGELLFTNSKLIRRKINLMDAAGTNRWNQVKVPASKLLKE